MARDTMYQRIRQAEQALNFGPRFTETRVTKGAAARQKFLDKTTASAWWKRRDPTESVTIEPSVYNCSWMSVSTRWIVRLWSPGGEDPLAVLPALHALAHVLAPLHVPHAHGVEFAKAYVELALHYDRALGAELKAQFKARKIKTSTWSPEAKQRAKDRVAGQTGSAALIALLAELQEEA